MSAANRDMSGPDVLRAYQRLATSGARAVASFDIGGRLHLAIPQLAVDVDGTPADMNGGDSDVDAIVYAWDDAGSAPGFAEVQRLPVHGGEDVEPFVIDGTPYLAVAGIRSGHGPYDMHTTSTVYRWDAGRFVPHQQIPTFAAKLWRYFAFDGRHFLVVAAGVAPELADGDPSSTIYEWDGTTFEPTQALTSIWAYDWEYFELDGERFLGLSDHVLGMRLHRWRGGRFERDHDIGGPGARDMAFRYIGDEAYLACAHLTSPSGLWRWDGERFALSQEFEGVGGRRFRFVDAADGLHLVRVNFIAGTREHPVAALDSQIYRWDGAGFVVGGSFPTSGGTDAAFFSVGDDAYLAVSNSLTADIRFGADSVVYCWDEIIRDTARTGDGRHG